VRRGEGGEAREGRCVREDDPFGGEVGEGGIGLWIWIWIRGGGIFDILLLLLL